MFIKKTHQKKTFSNKAFASVYNKGRYARKQGLPRIPPYKDKRTTSKNTVTWSRAFIRTWLDGWDDANT